jgi:uncharacterized protein YdhG (YjbR/CyaY superfamily)
MWASVSDIANEDVRYYFDSLEPEWRSRLFKLVVLLHQAMPSANLVMKYGMPTFFDQKSILHVAAWKHHCGVYPQAEAIQVFAHQLTDFSCSKGAIRLPHSTPFPEKVLLDIVAYRVKAIAGKASCKLN